MEGIIKTTFSKRNAKHGFKKARRTAKTESNGKKSIVTPFIKAALFGIALSVVLILVYALLLYKQILPADSMAVANAVIKIVSAALAAFVAIRGRTKRIWLTGGIAGGVYTLAAFLIFSLLSSTFSLSISLLSDIGMGVLCGMLFSMVLNAFGK